MNSIKAIIWYLVVRTTERGESFERKNIQQRGNLPVRKEIEVENIDKYEIPLWRKYTLSVQEAAKYFQIGDKKLKKLIEKNPDAEFILWNGSRPQIKRKLFEQFTDEKLSAI